MKWNAIALLEFLNCMINTKDCDSFLTFLGIILEMLSNRFDNCLSRLLSRPCGCGHFPARLHYFPNVNVAETKCYPSFNKMSLTECLIANASTEVVFKSFKFENNGKSFTSIAVKNFSSVLSSGCNRTIT